DSIFLFTAETSDPSTYLCQLFGVLVPPPVHAAQLLQLLLHRQTQDTKGLKRSHSPETLHLHA
ncbi:hypothetical protein AMECASPLE_027188, partial [Ameca splendens]